MKRIRIAVCDDQPEVLDEICNIIRSIRDLKNEDWIIDPYIRVTELLQNAASIDVAFLDLSMPEIDGMEAARELHSNYPACSIVIATGEIHRYKEAFTVKALRFVTKPFDSEEIREALLAAVKEKPGYDNIQVYRGRVLYSIRQQDILYVRSINSYVEIKALDGEVYRKDISLTEITKVLDSRLFVQTHRSYIANMKWITALDRTKAVLQKTEIPVSCRLYTSVLRKHASFELEFRL